MALLERQGRPTDIPETVADLVKGFAVLARSRAGEMSAGNAFTLLEIVQSLLARAERMEWEESVDLLREADTALNIQIAPRR